MSSSDTDGSFDLDGIRWLTADLVREIHDEVLEPGNLSEEDGAHPIESTLARIEQRAHYDDLEFDPLRIGVAYALAITKAHAFIDGNKCSSSGWPASRATGKDTADITLASCSPCRQAARVEWSRPHPRRCRKQGDYARQGIDSLHGRLPANVPLRIGVAYALTIAKAHAFIDGNKRTAFLSMVFFLRRHGYRLVDTDADAVADLMEAVAADEIDEDALYDALRPSVEVEIDSDVDSDAP
mgnify:CR=1 FL=1